jgi:hypothetical protein
MHKILTCTQTTCAATPLPSEQQMERKPFSCVHKHTCNFSTHAYTQHTHIRTSIVATYARTHTHTHTHTHGTGLHLHSTHIAQVFTLSTHTKNRSLPLAHTHTHTHIHTHTHTHTQQAHTKATPPSTCTQESPANQPDGDTRLLAQVHPLSCCKPRPPNLAREMARQALIWARAGEWKLPLL